MSDPRVTAVDVLRDHQQQLDMDGVMVGVSRQAIDEVLTELATLRAQNAALIEKMTAIEHSMRMASLPGNDWKREISLSTSLARNALAQVAK